MPVDYPGAAERYETLIKQNDLNAHYQLAKMHIDGLGVETDYDRAKTLLKMAARKGHEPSIKLAAEYGW